MLDIVLLRIDNDNQSSSANWIETKTKSISEASDKHVRIHSIVHSLNLNIT